MRSLFIAACCWVAGLPGFAHAREYRPHEGYLVTTEGERESRIEEMLVIQPPAAEGPTLHDRIFDSKLSQEFRERYEEKFGRTEVQRVYNSPNKYTYYDDLYGFRGTPQEVDDEKRRFGEFMIRRLTEYHVDNYARNDPKVRPVWEAKEKLSNVQLQVAQFRLDMAYSIAGNTLDLVVVNPWVSSKVTLLMDPGRFGPGPVDETIVSASRALTEATSVESHYYLNDGIASLILKRAHSANLATSLTASTFTKAEGKSTRETLYLAGLSFGF